MGCRRSHILSPERLEVRQQGPCAQAAAPGPGRVHWLSLAPRPPLLAWPHLLMPRALCRPLAPCSHCPQPSGHPALTRPTRSPGHPPAPTAQALAGRQWRRLPLSPAAGWPGHLCTLDLSKPLHWHFLGSQLSRGQWIPEASVQRQPADPKPLGLTCSPQHPWASARLFSEPQVSLPSLFQLATGSQPDATSSRKPHCLPLAQASSMSLSHKGPRPVS